MERYEVVAEFVHIGTLFANKVSTVFVASQLKNVYKNLDTPCDS